MKLLLHCGARIDVFDSDRNTALHVLTSTFQVYRPATAEQLAKCEEITKLFIEAGIHLDAVNCESVTAAQICTSRKYLELSGY